MSETKPDLRERLRVAAFQNACAKPYPDDGPEMTWGELNELSDLLREAAAALAAPRERKDHDLGLLGSTASGKSIDPPSTSGGWLPIATAPQDGTEILAWSDESREMDVTNWEFGSWTNGGDYYPFHPTHWMPLPAAPLPHGQDVSPQPPEGGGE